jgi:hypothetical protein
LCISRREKQTLKSGLISSNFAFPTQASEKVQVILLSLPKCFRFYFEALTFAIHNLKLVAIPRDVADAVSGKRKRIEFFESDISVGQLRTRYEIQASGRREGKILCFPELFDELIRPFDESPHFVGLLKS